MQRLTKFTIILALLALVFLPTASARAMGPFDGGPVIFGGSYTLASGDMLNGDLVVFGGDVTIEEDATVKGSIVIFGGNITLDGTMTQDLILIGASGKMGAKAVIEGDLVTVGGSLTRAEGSRIEGSIRDETAIEVPVPVIPEVPQIPEVPTVPEVPVAPQTPQPWQWNPLDSAFGVLGQAILLGALAMLLSLFLRPQMERVADGFLRQPLVAGGVGLLTVMVFPLLMVFMAVTILLILGIPFAVLALVLAWLFGTVSFGMEVGERFTKAAGQEWSPVLKAGFGTFLLVLVVQGIGLVPCIGWLTPFLVGAAAVGAVLLAFFEARNRPFVPAPGPDEPLPPAS